MIVGVLGCDTGTQKHLFNTQSPSQGRRDSCCVTAGEVPSVSTVVICQTEGAPIPAPPSLLGFPGADMLLVYVSALCALRRIR